MHINTMDVGSCLMWVDILEFPLLKIVDEVHSMQTWHKVKLDQTYVPTS